jgi:hypothetical protein
MTATFLPAIANAIEIFAEVVVLPTPPLPEVTTMTRATELYLMTCLI